MRERHLLLQRLLTDASRIVPTDSMAEAFAEHAFGHWSKVRARGVLDPRHAATAAVATRSTLGVLAPTQSATVDRLLISIGRNFAAARSSAEIVVLGSCLDDLAVMAAGNVFVTGPMKVEEYDRAIARYGVGRILSPYRDRQFWMFDEGFEISQLPRAYFDWSFGVVPRVGSHLALDPRTLRRQGVACAETLVGAPERAAPIHGGEPMNHIERSGTIRYEPPDASGPLADALSHVVGDARLEGASEVRGYVVDLNDLSRRFVVELRLDGAPAGIARAELFEPALSERGWADGCFGFAFALPDRPGSAERASVFIANSERRVGASLSIADLRRPANGGTARSDVEWLGGLRFAGWIDSDDAARPAEVSVFVDGECVARVLGDRWTPRGRFPVVGSAQRFEASLPSRFADGRLRRAHFRDAAGRELPSSPCEFVAFEDGLAEFLRRLAPIDSEALRGRLYDKLVPQAIPFEDFAAWKQRFAAPGLAPEARSRVAVALIGDDGLAESVGSLNSQEGCEWVAASLPDASEGEGMEFEPRDLERFFAKEASDCGLVVFARSGTLFDPRALGLLADAMNEARQAPSAYSDVAVRSGDGSIWPLAYPAFDYERMLEQGYAAPFFAIRKTLAIAALEEGVCDLYRLFNFCLDRTRGVFATPSGAQPVHVPGFLATIVAPDPYANAERLARATRQHCAAIGLDASVTAAGDGA